MGGACIGLQGHEGQSLRSGWGMYTTTRSRRSVTEERDGVGGACIGLYIVVVMDGVGGDCHVVCKCRL